MDININKSLPNSHALASNSSKKAKKHNFLLFEINLALIFIAILCELISPDFLRVLAGILFLLGSFSTLMLALKQFEKKWYNSRALAESIKTLSWKYALGGRPFITNLPDHDVRTMFLDNIKDITVENKEFREVISPASIDNDEITYEMSQCRKLSLGERKTIYLKHRIKEQKTWYVDKSIKYSKYMKGFIVFIILAEFLSALFSFLIDIHFPITILLANITFILFSILQAKQFNELSQAYFVTAKDIHLIEEKYKEVNTEDEFTKFVDEAEMAFSREHTLWLARRDAELIRSKIR